MGARNPGKGSEKVAELQKKGFPVELITIDVTSDSSIDAAAEEVALKYGHLDILINNAGICLERTPNGAPAPMTREMFQDTFNTNVFRAAITTEAFILLLKKSIKVPRIVFVTSSLGSLGRKAEGTHVSSKREFPIYRASKSAMNMLCLHYDLIFKEAGWKVNTCDPGLVLTAFLGRDIPEHIKLALLAGGAPVHHHALSVLLDDSPGNIALRTKKPSFRPWHRRYRPVSFVHWVDENPPLLHKLALHEKKASRSRFQLEKIRGREIGE